MFRGSITRPARSLCTLRSVDCSTTTQHTVPAGGQPWPGGIGHPQGPAERFPSDILHPSSSFPRLRLAQANRIPMIFAANGDAIAVNATGVEITPGCASAFIEGATKLATRGDSNEQSTSELHRRE